MWTRKELKSQAKEALKRNYLKAVLIAFLVMFIGDALLLETVTGNLYAVTDIEFAKINYAGSELGMVNALLDEQENAVLTLSGMITGLFAKIITPTDWTEDTVIPMMAEALKGVVIFSAVFGLLYELFAVNIFAVGIRTFFVKSLTGESAVKEAFSSFGKNYFNIFKVMLLRDIKIILWSLLLLLPVVAAMLLGAVSFLRFIFILATIPVGIYVIYKIYDYEMVPYILAENPQMSAANAFYESSRLMEGEKWKVFVLQLSFIGWTLLSACTFDLLAISFVAPYQCYTYAALYRKLSPIEEKEAEKVAV